MPNMQLSIQERKDFSVPTLMDKKPKYPYGLKITLNSEELKKIGMPGDLKVGSTFEFEITAEVISVAQEPSEGDENNTSVQLQITDMYLDLEEEDTVSMMYGE